MPTYQTYLKGAQDIYEGTINITNNNITNNETTIIDNSTNIDNSTTINNPVININPVTDNSNNSVTNNTDNSVNTTVNDSTVSNLNGNDNNGSIVNGSDNTGVTSDDESIAGLVFTYGRSKYKINSDEKTVSYVCAANSKMTNLIIPKKVSYKKNSFKVTGIAKNACKGMKNRGKTQKGYP